METDANGAAEEGAAGRPKPDGPAAEPNGTPETYRIALSLGHLETRIKAAQSLDSPHEYRVFLLAYAKKLADEGLRSKAEELIRELLGPIYQCVPLYARALSPPLITCFRRTANLARRKRTSGRRRCWAWRNASSCGTSFASWVSLAFLRSLSRQTLTPLRTPLAKQRTTAPLAGEYQDLLKKISSG